MGDSQKETIGHLQDELAQARARIADLERQVSLCRTTKLADSLPQIVFEVNATGDILYTNDYSLEMFGYSRDELEHGMNIRQVLHPSTLEASLDSVRRVFSGESMPSREHLALRKDGTTFPAKIYSKLIRHEDGSLTARGIMIDISDIKEAEEALRESEARHHALSTATFEAILILHDGIITEVNQAAVEMSGYSEEELIGRKSIFLAAEKDRALARRMIATNREEPYEAELVRKDGSTFPAEVRGRIFSYRGAQVRAAAVRDLTWRKEMEEQYSDIFHNAIEGIYRSNREGKFLTANRSLAAILGYDSPEELIAEVTDIPRQCYANPGVREVFLALMDRHGRVTNFEFQVVDRNGNKVWLSESARAVRDRNGALRYYEGFMVDITKRKYVENTTMALYSISKAISTTRDLRELYETIHSILGRFVDVSNFLIGIMDEKTRHMRFPYLEDEHLDADPQEAMDQATPLVLEVVKTGSPLLLANDRPQDLATALQAGLETPLPAVWLGVPLKIRNRIMGAMAVYHYDNPQRYTEEDVDFMMAVSEQVALAVERKSSDEELYRANARLEIRVDRRTRALKEQAAELARANARLKELDEVKSTLISSISHELRTPLTSVRGFAKLAAKEFRKHFSGLAKNDPILAKKAERIVTDLEIIEKEGQRLTRLINDFLDLNRIEAGKTQWHDAKLNTAEVIAQAVATVQGEFSDNPDVDLVLDLEPDLQPVFMDGDKMEQVLLNLLNNASKFTENGLVRISGRNLDGYVEIRVADTGIGIPEGEQEYIFDRFHKLRTGDTLTTCSEGTGLGLAICREIVEHYTGAIRVESEPGKGATFIFTLPAMGGAKVQ